MNTKKFRRTIDLMSGSPTLDRSINTPSRRRSTLNDDDDNENDFGDDFDDFEEGAQAGADDDFGDFDDGFQEPEAVEESPPVSTAQVNTITVDPFVSSTLSSPLPTLLICLLFTAPYRFCCSLLHTGPSYSNATPPRRHVPTNNRRRTHIHPQSRSHTRFITNLPLRPLPFPLETVDHTSTPSTPELDAIAHPAPLPRQSRRPRRSRRDPPTVKTEETRPPGHKS